MKYIYKLYIYIYCENIYLFFSKINNKNFEFQSILNNFSLDDFLKTNPDSELQNIFISLLIVFPIFFGNENQKIIEYSKDNILKLEQKAQLDIIFKIFKYTHFWTDLVKIFF